MKIENKVAIITGASSGFGTALAKRLTAKGAKVVLGDISLPSGEALVNELNKKHGKNVAIFQKCDVVNKDDQIRLFKTAMDVFKQIDIVVNNAGIAESNAFTADLEDEWVKVLRIDLEAVILGTRLAITALKKNPNGGAIINVASLAGLYPQSFQPVYAAAKGGVVHFTRSLEYLQKSDNIGVVAICPSFSPTAILDGGKKTFGPNFKIVAAMQVPVELVIDAFVKGIEEKDAMAGKCIRVTPEKGIDLQHFPSAAKMGMPNSKM